MATTVHGTSTILKGARLICRGVAKFGTVRLSADTSAAFAAAVNTFVAACLALEVLDDRPYVIDPTAPRGPEDVTPE